MEKVFAVDWEAMFVPSTSLIEMVVRGTLVYLFLFLTLRFLLKRQAGMLNIADLLVIVVIADAVQNAMGSTYESVTEGAVLVLTIVFWDYAIDWLAFRFPAVERFVRPQPVLLIDRGRLLRRNMDREMITESELKTQLRHHGIESEAEVKAAAIEADGKLSVIKKRGGEEDAGEQQPGETRAV